jgi:IS5 family transposase
VDQRGAPLCIQITPANAHDVTAVLDLLNHPIVSRPKTKYIVHHLCADKANDSEPLRTQLRRRRFKPHIRKREYDSDPPSLPLEAHKYPARRWVVEYG